MTSMVVIHEPNHAPAAHIIFVHGLGGDSMTTWGFEKIESWKTWIVAERPDVKIWSLEYQLEATEWKGGAMPLFDRATNVLAVLQTTVLGDRPIIFVCHSFGGLLVKQILRNAITVSKDYESLVARTTGVIFIATPHAGSGAAQFASYLSFFLRASVAVSELQPSGAQLRELNLWFRNNFETLKIISAIFFETKRTANITVVDATSADPGIAGLTPIPVDADHFQICKPTRSKDVVVLQTISAIGRAVPFALRGADSLTQKFLTAATLEDLKKLRHEINLRIQRFPDDLDAHNIKDKVEDAIRYEGRTMGSPAEQFPSPMSGRVLHAHSAHLSGLSTLIAFGAFLVIVYFGPDVLSFLETLPALLGKWVTELLRWLGI